MPCPSVPLSQAHDECPKTAFLRCVPTLPRASQGQHAAPRFLRPNRLRNRRVACWRQDMAARGALRRKTQVAHLQFSMRVLQPNAPTMAEHGQPRTDPKRTRARDPASARPLNLGATAANVSASTRPLRPRSKKESLYPRRVSYACPQTHGSFSITRPAIMCPVVATKATHWASRSHSKSQARGPSDGAPHMHRPIGKVHVFASTNAD